MDVEQAYARYLSQHFGGERETNQNYQLQERYFRKNYLPHLPSNKDVRIIDLGTGLGHFLYFLKRAGYHNILGVDVGREVITVCEGKGFPVEQAEVTDYLQHLQEPVDVFIMNDILEHQPKEHMWKMLELVKKHLSPTGRVLVKVPNMGNPLLGNDGRYIDITHELGFDQHSLKQTLLMAGFEEVAIVGTDIYVTNNQILNVLARLIAGLLDKLFYFVFHLYGRTDTKIFTKNILAIGYKKHHSPSQPKRQPAKGN